MRISGGKLVLLSNDDDTGKVVESFNHKDLIPVCEVGGCVPSGFEDVNANGKVPEFRFVETEEKQLKKFDKDAIQSQLGPMVTKIGDEKFCRVFEWNRNSIIEPWAFCVIVAETTQIDTFNGLMIETETKMAEIQPVETVPEVPVDTEFTAEYY